MDDLSRRHEAEHRLAERDRRRDAIRAALGCLAWCLAGLLLIATSFHITGPYARPLFLAGIAVGNGGIIFTLLAAYRRGEQRGDW